MCPRTTLDQLEPYLTLGHPPSTGSPSLDPWTTSPYYITYLRATLTALGPSSAPSRASQTGVSRKIEPRSSPTRAHACLHCWDRFSSRLGTFAFQHFWRDPCPSAPSPALTGRSSVSPPFLWLQCQLEEAVPPPPHRDYILFSTASRLRHWYLPVSAPSCVQNSFFNKS